MTTPARAVLAVAAALAVVVPVRGSHALAPTVTLDRAAARPGERVVVTLRDWTPRSSVVASVCGNDARRGTNDCDLEHAAGMGLSDADVVHKFALTVTAPPAPCPCVVRVANATQSSVVMVPIAIAGHPSAPVVDHAYRSPLVLHADVARVSDGMVGSVRSWLGGRTAYRLTVTVRNRSAEEYAGVRIRALASRGGSDQARVVELPEPGAIRGGKTWRHTERVTLAAPVVGAFVWKVSASGAGPVLTAEVASHNRPVLLYVLGALLVADVAAIAQRWTRRRALRPR